ncbi:MAG: NifB/NifX family molybdenum-iron cluster-binding protein [Spirochaetia bacterium]
MKIAMPIHGGKLSQHFGHSEQFSLIDVEDQSIHSREDLTPPPHEPGLLPRWLKEKGVTLVIAGGMGQRAQAIFEQAGIEVICGAPSQEPDEVLNSYLKGTLETGDNACDH